MDIFNTGDAAAITALSHDNAINYQVANTPIVGKEAIVKEYAYMNNVNYILSLKPIKLEMITKNLALEIG